MQALEVGVVLHVGRISGANPKVYPPIAQLNVAALSTIPTILTNMNLELSALKPWIQSLSDNLVSNTQVPQVGDIILKKSYAQVVGSPQVDRTDIPLVSVDQTSSSQASTTAGTSPNTGKGIFASNLNNQFRTAVSSAVHLEFKSISSRASNIVISGLASRSGKSDKERFGKFCQQYFNFSPSVHSPRRLGSIKKRKIQPLLITLNNFADADYLLNNANSLRRVTDKYVPSNIYINKHFTSAEAKPISRRAIFGGTNHLPNLSRSVMQMVLLAMVKR